MTFSTDAIFSALGGGGLVTIVLALIAWARSKDKDQADVAKQWESGVSTVLRLAEQQAESLAADLTRTREQVAVVQHDLDDCQRQVRQLRALLGDTLTDLDQRGADTTEYRQRFRAI